MRLRKISNLLAIAILISIKFSSTAQVKVGDNPTTMNSSAILEVESTTKGFLPPRVALTSTSSASPLASHVQGMVVFNTATTGDVVPALYVNDGTKWMKAVAASTTSNSNSNIVTLDVGQTATYYSGPIASSSWANSVLLSALAPTNLPISFEGLTMNVIKGDATYWRPRIYNASNTSSVTFSFSALANANNKVVGTKTTLAAGTSNFVEIDGDALAFWSNNGNQETETMDIIINEKWYRGVWLGYQIDNVHYVRMTLSRIQ